MTLRQLLVLIGLATGLLWIAWVWVLFTIDPFSTNVFGFIFFYVTLYLSLTGSLAIAGFFFRKARLKEQMNFHLVTISFRQAIILSALLCSLLIMQGQGVVAWWNMLLVLFVAVLAESILLIKTKKRPKSDIEFTVSSVSSYIPADPQFTKKDI
jgi:Ca2+/Na+ antiporter